MSKSKAPTCYISANKSNTRNYNQNNDTVTIGYLHKNFIDDTKIDLWSNKIVFKMVMKTLDTKNIFNKNNEMLDQVNQHRRNYINKLLDVNYRHILDETNEKISREFVVGLDNAWIKQFMDSLDTIETTDRFEMMNSRIYRFYNYRIIIKDTEECDDQAITDYVGLCWLYYAEHNIASGTELDVIVSNRGFKMFFAIILAIDIYNELVKYPVLYNFYANDGKFEIGDIKILTQTNGLLSFPPKTVLERFPKQYVEHYARWVRVPYFK